MTTPDPSRRSRQIHVPVNATEFTEIEAHAAKAGLGKAAFLRNLGVGHAPPAAIDQTQIDRLWKVNADLGRLGGLLKWWLSDEGKLAASQVPRGRLETVLNDLRVTQQHLRRAIDALHT